MKLSIQSRELGFATKQPFHTIELEFEELPDVILTNRWSQCIWKDGVRLSQNFLYSDFIVLDIDDGYPLSDAVKRFKFDKHIIATTKSHQKQKGENPPCDRYRVVLVAEKRIIQGNWLKATQLSKGRMLNADTNCCDAARAFAPSVEIVSVNLNGGTCPIHYPPEIRYRKNDSKLPEDFRPSRLMDEVAAHGLPAGSRNATFFKIAYYMKECGRSADDVDNFIRGRESGLSRRDIESTLNSVFKR